jgi:hypothetical protein
VNASRHLLDFLFAQQASAQADQYAVSFFVGHTLLLSYNPNAFPVYQREFAASGFASQIPPDIVPLWDTSMGARACMSAMFSGVNGTIAVFTRPLSATSTPAVMLTVTGAVIFGTAIGK